jgi:hypothetical protein
VDEFEDNETLQPGDRCEDCGTIVASDGECECNQDEE